MKKGGGELHREKRKESSSFLFSKKRRGA